MRLQPGVFLRAGLLIFIPLGLFDVFDDTIQEPLSEIDAEVSTGEFLLAIGVASLHAGVALLGDVLYTGIVARAVVAVRDGTDHSLRAVIRELPYWRLAGADILLALVVALGLILLVVPGLIFLAWFALIAPAIEVEDRRIVDGFRRSRALVRGNTLRVLVLVLPLILVDDALASLIQSGEVLHIGDTFLGDWVTAIVADLVTAPFYALAVVVAFFQLRDLSPAIGRGAPTR